MKHPDSWWVVQFGDAILAISDETATYIQSAYTNCDPHVKFTTVYDSLCFYLMKHFVGMRFESKDILKNKRKQNDELSKYIYEIEG